MVYDTLLELQLDGKDISTSADQTISTLRKRLIKQSWKHIERVTMDVIGVSLFKHTFEIAPESLQLFPFKNHKNYMESSQLKQHAAGVVGTIGKVIMNIDNVELLIQVLKALGQEHNTRMITQEHFDLI